MARFATTFPAPNQVLWKQSTGGTLAITVSGVAQRDQSIFNATQEIETAVTGISVQLGSAFPVEATVVDGRNQKSWSATLYAPAGVGQTISVTAAIMHTISDRRTGDLISSSTSTETETLLISVQEDSEAPKVELISGPVPLPGAVFGVGIGVKLSDSGSGLQSFAWSLDGSAFTPLAIGNEREFELTVQVPLASRTGAYEWIGRASDQVGYVTDLRLTLQDNSVPELEITYPQNNVKVPHDGRSGRIILKGTVKDPWSGVSRVEWSVDGGAFTPVLTGDGWANWTAPVVFGPNDAGRFHRVTVRAVDNLNLSIEKQLDLEVARPYQPREAKDLVSSRAYLQDLLEFSETHARTRPNDTALRPSDLNQTFYQPFDRLAEPLPITDLGNRPVNQVRLAIEVLRQYLRSVPSGLVAHWTFDEGSGPRAADATGNGHHGYVHNTSWTTGRTGGALQFDGVSSFVEVANPAALVHDSAQKESAKALSISVWIYPTGSGSGANGEGGILVNKEGEFEVARFSDGTIRWAFANVDPGWKWIDTTAIAPLNTWSHVAVTFDNGTVTTYLNGSPAHVYPGSGVISTVAPGISDLRLGARQHTSQHFHGLLEDVRIYRLAIDAAAVAALAGIVKLPALLAHWPCDELGGTVLGDITPNRSQGTLLDGATLSYVNGRQAVTFDGAQGRVEIPNTSFLEVGMQGADFSVAFWLYLREGATGKWRAIVHKGDQNTERTFALWMRPDDNRVHYRISTDEDWNEGGDSVAEVRLLTWTHISYVKKGERLALYINGTLDSSAELRGRSQGNSGPLYLGADPWYPGIAGGLHEIRIYDRPLSAIEVAALATDLAGAEARYRQTAYEALLNRLGVSYADIRLARGAQAEERKSLAERLGVRLSPTRPDELDELRLHPSQITDSFLESFCGLGDTRLDPLQPVVPAPKLLAWQLDNLRALWLQQDHPTMAGATASSLIIDPDVMGRADLRNAYPTDKAFELWEERRNWLQGAITELQEKRTTFADPEDALNAAMGLAFSTPVAQVWQLADDQANGVDIRPALAKLNLFPGMFRRLCRVRALAQAGAVTDDEWEDVDDILIAVQKAQLEPAWRTAEKTLALSPDWFVVNDDAGALPRWRVPGTARIDWQDRLQARIGQQRNAEEAYWSAVAAAEEVALPLMRDALVSVVAASQGLSNAADWLTEQLLVDFKGNGSQQTTRIEQAIETIQVALTSLRMERFATGHLAAQWCRRPDQSEADFDEEWKWMGSYASWRAAMLVFFFPENLLLPGLLLRMDRATSPHYENFMAKLREKSRLRPDVARKTVDQEYLAPLKADAAVEPAIRDVVFQITDQLDHRGFETRRALSEQLMRNWVDGATGRLRSDTPAYLNEAFYFVPMQVALQLQKSGEYVAALDWYQTVYAFNLLDNPATADVDERAIYYALRLEQNTQPNLSRVGRWLFDLNPHVIAAGRPNPYMRYTLMCIARCFLEYADAEFARDTGESLAHARDLYLAARRLLQSPHLQTPPVIDSTQIVLPNPVLESLHWRVENQLAKLRQGRNIAGMKRQVELPLPAAPLSSGLPSASTTDQLPGPPSQVLRPTPYRYQVLIERSKQLANIAQQMEANYLSLLEKRDVEEARRIEAGFRLDVAKATESMQALRVTEATNGVELARRQMKRARIQQNKYQEWIDAGLNDWEQQMIRSYRKAGEAEKSAHLFGAAVQIAQAITTASTAFGWEKLGAYASVAAVSTGALGAAINNNLAIDAQTQAQIASIGASHERRRQEWELQKSLADQDYAIGEQQALIASDHVAIRKQEQAISTIQTEEAKAIADFLARKFTNVELYEWMSGVLAGIYSYFLQQATSMAQLAQNQLIFERQTPSPGFILADYWQPPADAGGSTTGGQATDRRGMTGAERLLADIYRLDLYAFENDRRKLNLAQTFSLAQMAPYEFQRFRETGILPFATPARLFDAGFPGHYLRLIKRVRTSVIALIPPVQGIRATLVTSGISRCVVGGDIFQEIVIRREPEVVALTSPMNATGIFELDTQPDMLLPFESMGVDTSWEFQMPRTANSFDFNTITDILVTIEYTTLNSFDYRQQVIKKLNPQVNSDRAFSFRREFADAWYDLHHNETAGQPLSVTFEVLASDFPPNLDRGSLSVDEILMYFVRSPGQKSSILWNDDDWEAQLSHTFVSPNGAQLTIPVTPAEAKARPLDGAISTKRGNAAGWRKLTGAGISPVGIWTLTLPDEANVYFQAGMLEDILFVITFAGRTPPWPA